MGFLPSPIAELVRAQHAGQRSIHVSTWSLEWLEGSLGNVLPLSSNFDPRVLVQCFPGQPHHDVPHTTGFLRLDLALSRDNDTIDSSKMGFSLLKKCVFSLEGSPTHLEPMNEAASWGVVWLRSADKTRVWWKSETGETSNDPILPNTQKRRGFGRFQWWSMMTINGLLIWRFPEIGVPPNHPFIDGFSLVDHYKPSSYWGIFHLWKPPYCWKVPSQSSQFSRWGARQQRGGGGRWSQGAKLAVLEGFRSVCLGGLIILYNIYNITYNI